MSFYFILLFVCRTFGTVLYHVCSVILLLLLLLLMMMLLLLLLLFALGQPN